MTTTHDYAHICLIIRTSTSTSILVSRLAPRSPLPSSFPPSPHHTLVSHAHHPTPHDHTQPLTISARRQGQEAEYVASIFRLEQRSSRESLSHLNVSQPYLRTTKLSDVKELVEREGDDRRHHRRWLSNPKENLSPRTPPALVANSRRQEANAGTLARCTGFNESPLSLGMTLENIRPLLENAKEVQRGVVIAMTSSGYWQLLAVHYYNTYLRLFLIQRKSDQPFVNTVTAEYHQKRRRFLTLAFYPPIFRSLPSLPSKILKLQITAPLKQAPGLLPYREDLIIVHEYVQTSIRYTPFNVQYSTFDVVLFLGHKAAAASATTQTWQGRKTRTRTLRHTYSDHTGYSTDYARHSELGTELRPQPHSSHAHAHAHRLDTHTDPRRDPRWPRYRSGPFGNLNREQLTTLTDCTSEFHSTFKHGYSVDRLSIGSLHGYNASVAVDSSRHTPVCQATSHHMLGKMDIDSETVESKFEAAHTSSLVLSAGTDQRVPFIKPQTFKLLLESPNQMNVDVEAGVGDEEWRVIVTVRAGTGGTNDRVW
ncbi:hypothetical protein BC629DRAFT_1445631 [Irpex lacteus]|nr:hypothetical protein BC629DRAFT_1445631 [Irpex lacteus]